MRFSETGGPQPRPLPPWGRGKGEGERGELGPTMQPLSPSTNSSEPRAEYTRLRDAYRVEQTYQVRLERIFGNARLGTFLAGMALLYFAIGARSISVYWLAVPAGVFLLLLIRHERVRASLSRCRQAIAYYENGLDRLADQWAGKGKPGSHYLTEEHPYAVDLDLFGGGSLFERLCTARTRAGADRLAAWLLNPADRDEILQRQEAVAELQSRQALREALAVMGADVPEGVDFDGLARWGAGQTLLTSRSGRVLAAVLVAASVGLLAGWLLGDMHLYPFAGALLIQGAFAGWFRRRVHDVISPIDRRAHDLALLGGILARIEREQFQSARLRTIQALLDAHGEAPSRRVGQLVRLVHWLDCRNNPYFGLLAPLLLWTTQMAFAFESWRAHSGPFIGRWVEAVAQFEALCSLASYAYENPGDPFPEVVATAPCYDGDGLGHPLLPEARCVRNDLHLSGDLQLLVVSGSNMSGKSTLLRTVGVNAVLALAGAPVRARRLRLSPLAIGATLRVQDSLQEGRSRFYTEISRISRIVARARGPVPLLFLLDEILHGTNSHDRRLGAAAIVRSLVDRGAIGLVTTHDLALTHIVDELGTRAANVHFEDHFENGTLQFDYVMRPGVVQNSNALALMRAVGLEV